jgi:hypothetical protein
MGLRSPADSTCYLGCESSTDLVEDKSFFGRVVQNVYPALTPRVTRKPVSG